MNTFSIRRVPHRNTGGYAREDCMSDANENLIQSNPDIMMGKPVIRGTRITV